MLIVLVLITGCATVETSAPPSAFARLEAACMEGTLLQGAAEGDGESWPFVVQITQYDPNTGTFEGRIEWTTLEAVHRIEGLLAGDTLIFQEVEYIQEGFALLDCSYVFDLTEVDGQITGTWGGCGGFSGTVFLELP
jgi:hypothetical protein